MSDDKKKKTRAMPVLKAYYLAAIKYPWLLASVFIGGLIIEGVSVSGALVLRHVIDQLTNNVPSAIAVSAILLTLGTYALLSLGGWTGQRIRQVALTLIEPKVMADLSNSAFAYILGHSHDFFSSNFTGTLTRRVNRYARSFESVLDTISFKFFSTFIYVIGILIVLTIHNLILGGVVLAWTIIFVYLQIAMTRWRQPLRIKRAEEDSKVTGVLSDAIGNYSTVNLFASEKFERSIFGAAIERWRIATNTSWVADNWIWGIQGLFVITVQIALLATGIVLWGKGEFSVGDFVLIQLYLIGLIDRVWDIGNAMRQLYDAFADAYEMVEILEKPHEVQDMPGALPLTLTEGKISFNDVAFSFEGNRDILSGFNLSILAGEKIALVGPSGAGKSTITKLLLRLYDVTSGSIQIDNQIVSEKTQESLREAISFVPQEPVLFHRTLRENISYAKPDASMEEVIDAAKKARCHEFIDQLPLKYETYVGERGIKLSGGERQRVAIARAILKDAPILILDEATSSLDSESEHLIQDALRVLMEGKTVIVIAHRLSTIMTMDRIVVIEGGKIAAEGTHTELLDDKSGLYHKLWSIQAGSFLTDAS